MCRAWDAVTATLAHCPKEIDLSLGQRWKLSKWVEWLTSSGRELDYNKWGLTWPETWETPSKTSSAFHLGDTERAGTSCLLLPAQPCLNPGFLLYLLF